MEQSWINALAGGALIGLSATIHLLFSGRVTGVSGIVFGILKPLKGDTLWRVKFVIGLVIGGLIGAGFQAEPFVNTTDRSMMFLIVAGLLVGFGTRLGSGCTSGHGVCGISRLSPRSLAATASFMVAGIATVFVINLMMGV